MRGVNGRGWDRTSDLPRVKRERMATAGLPARSLRWSARVLLRRVRGRRPPLRVLLQFQNHGIGTHDARQWPGGSTERWPKRWPDQL